MARQRKITADDILNATERVILRLGTAALSIDAVAKEAGVSKSRVVYDHKSKSGLLAALMDRHYARKQDALQKLIDEQAHSPNPELFGRIAEAECAPNDVERAVFMAVSAALPSDAELQAKVQTWVAEDMQAVAVGARPQAAKLALLALSGLCWTEFSGFHAWSPQERRRLLDGIRAICTSLPEPEPQSLPQDPDPAGGEAEAASARGGAAAQAPERPEHLP